MGSRCPLTAARCVRSHAHRRHAHALAISGSRVKAAGSSESQLSLVLTFKRYDPCQQILWTLLGGVLLSRTETREIAGFRLAWGQA